MSREGVRRAMRWAMAAFYAGAGALHLSAPDVFLAITPDWVPLPREVVLATGVGEVAGAAALLTHRLRPLAGLMLALYAIAVFPANLKHAFYNVSVAGVTLNWWYHAPRLALQPALVWWALYCSGVVDWPWSAER